MIAFPHYVEIKDKYCIAYYGNSDEYLIQLKLLRPLMEKTFPGIRIWLSCKDDAIYLLADEPRIINRSNLLLKEKDFGYIREILYNASEHPIEALLNESSIPIEAISIPAKTQKTTVCILYPENNFGSLSENQIKYIQNFVHGHGYTMHIGGNYEYAGWVIGVENALLFQAAAFGIQTSLISGAFGENLYKKMFPAGKIFVIPE